MFISGAECGPLVLLVRDAAARLPNGEGTRAEICELLKDSQFLAPDVTSAQVPNTVSLCVSCVLSYVLAFKARCCVLHTGQHSCEWCSGPPPL